MQRKKDTVEQIWKLIMDTLENMKNDMNIHCEKYRAFYKEYYWNSIKIMNYDPQNKNVKLMEQMCEYSEVMVVYAQQIEKIVQDVLGDIYRFRCMENEKSEEACTQISVIRNKMEIVKIINLKYTQELETYMKCMGVVENVLRQDSKVQGYEKIKRFIQGRGKQ